MAHVRPLHNPFYLHGLSNQWNARLKPSTLILSHHPSNWKPTRIGPRVVQPTFNPKLPTEKLQPPLLDLLRLKSLTGSLLYWSTPQGWWHIYLPPTPLINLLDSLILYELFFKIWPFRTISRNKYKAKLNSHNKLQKNTHIYTCIKYTPL